MFILFIVLRINFNVLDYSIFENGTLSNAIRFLFQETQYPFYVNFIPETIDAAEALYLGEVISSDTIDDNTRATAGISISLSILLCHILVFCRT